MLKIAPNHLYVLRVFRWLEKNPGLCHLTLNLTLPYKGKGTSALSLPV